MIPELIIKVLKQKNAVTFIFSVPNFVGTRETEANPDLNPGETLCTGEAGSGMDLMAGNIRAVGN